MSDSANNIFYHTTQLTTNTFLTFILMKIRNLIIAAALTLAPATTFAGDRYANKSVSDSLLLELKKATDAQDSLPLMCDLFDILPRDTAFVIGMQAFHVANRAGNSSVALEMIRHLANRSVRSDSMLKELSNMTLRYSNPDNVEIMAVNREELRETRAFIKIKRNYYRARVSEAEERQALLMELVQTMAIQPPADLYDRIVLQDAICMMLAKLGAKDLLTKELDKLGTYINELPPTATALRNAYYVNAALLYSDNGEYEKSMQADRKTLEGIEQLEERYRANNRKYRNFDANRYIIYTRFLSNFPVLPPHEIEEYYNAAMEIVERDYTASETNAAYPGPQIYYNLSYKNYAKAMPLIKKAIANPYNAQHYRRLLKYEIECAEALGDNESLIKASREYNTLLENYLTERLDEKFREFQVISETSEITDKYNRLFVEKKLSEAKALRLTVIIAILAAIILLVSMIVLFTLNRKNRSLVKTLDKSNHALRIESENLENSRKELIKARDVAQKANNLKTDFIKNMSYEVSAPLKAINEYSKLIVDCADASNRKYLERFTALVELNSELLTTIVNDVLHISEIDSNSVPVNNRSTDLRSLCTMVLDGVRHRVAPSVALQFDTASPQISLFTDPQRLHQILLNLLTNAAKFTVRGSITLGYSIDEDAEKVIFTVTDTGIGIKADKKEAIFDRFVKLDKETQGAGLGLTISRMLARILGGDVYLDTTYTKGARFVLTLPKK